MTSVAVLTPSPSKSWKIQQEGKAITPLPVRKSGGFPSFSQGKIYKETIVAFPKIAITQVVASVLSLPCGKEQAQTCCSWMTAKDRGRQTLSPCVVIGASEQFCSTGGAGSEPTCSGSQQALVILIMV